MILSETGGHKIVRVVQLHVYGCAHTQRETGCRDAKTLMGKKLMGAVPMGAIMPDFYPLGIFIASQFFPCTFILGAEKSLFLNNCVSITLPLNKNSFVS